MGIVELMCMGAVIGWLFSGLLIWFWIGLG